MTPRTWGSIEEVVKIFKMLTKKSVEYLNFWAERPYTGTEAQVRRGTFQPIFSDPRPGYKADISLEKYKTVIKFFMAATN